MKKTAIIIGAGPAGLTAAYELLRSSKVAPLILEADRVVGGISRTVVHKGNRMDIGGHRFFSKSDRVMEWWRQVLPLQGSPARDDKSLGRPVPVSRLKGAPDPDRSDRVMLVRSRLSRIFYLRRFFDYPVTLNGNTVRNLGLVRMAKIGISYVLTRLFPVRPETTLEDFFINRFGLELYRTFFRDYTEKVWGHPCDRISKEWGAQRIKGLSLTRTLLHAAASVFRRKKSGPGQLGAEEALAQKKTETSLIDQFLYPKFGPGHLWEEVAGRVKKSGGCILTRNAVCGLRVSGRRIVSVTVRDARSGKKREIRGDYFISTMPVRDLVRAFGQAAPANVRETAEGLEYRDFITVGLLLKKLKIRNETKIPTVNGVVPDNWIYVQERDVKVGRIQIFNNWSPYLVRDPDTVWIGLEYFCAEGDALWSKKDRDMSGFAVKELEKIGIIDPADVLDSVVIRVPKTYPAYFGTYGRFGEIRAFTDRFENLFLAGRNGMHRYNNMDHSMLSAMEAVRNIASGRKDKDNIWAVNTEEDYHEEKK